MESVLASWKKVMWTVMVISLTLLCGLYSLLVNLSKVDGKVPFLSSSLVLVIEILKLITCVMLLGRSFKPAELFDIPVKDMIPYSVPAICYALNNNLAVFMQTQMDPATYMVLSNLKTLTTGILYQSIMKQRLSRIQWFALCLLTLGGAFSSVTALQSKQVHSLSHIYCTELGLVTMGSYCFISGFAGVFTEYQYKSAAKLTVFHQNILLYSFGIVFNACLWVWQNVQKLKESADTSQSFHLFAGFSWMVWAIVGSQCLVGLGMSIIMKYKSNMTRVFVISTAPLITTILSYIFLDLHLQPLFLVAVLFVVAASFIYNWSKSTAPADDSLK